MRRIIRFWKIVIIDIVAVLIMLTALAIGWLPGPGGIPLFLIGLGLLAINHTWAERYMVILKEYANRLGDLIFIPKLRIFYDLLAPALLVLGTWMLVRRSAVWMVSLGISSSFMALVVFLGNRGRWDRIRQLLKRKR